MMATDIQASLAEAAAYERLALERRRGLVGMVMATLLGAFVAVRVLAEDASSQGVEGFLLLALMFTAAASITAVLKARPGWEPIFERPKMRAVWVRFAVLGLGLALSSVAIELAGGETGLPDHARSALLAAILAAALAGAKWAKRSKAIPTVYTWTGPLVASLLLLARFVPPGLELEVTIGCMALAGLVESSVRLFGPRTWFL